MPNFLWIFSITLMWVAAILNLVQAFRSQRYSRWTHEMRVIMWAYEKELLERGVSLPPRCPFCIQILPRHVDGCPIKHEIDRFHEYVSRPPIKYYPKGLKPPDLGGGHA